MNKPVTDLPHPKMLLDPYAGWAANEGVPITEDFGVDLRTVPTAPWARFDTNGGIVHLKGRGDFVSIFVLDLAPGAKSSPQKHLFEEVASTVLNGARRASSLCRSTPAISTSIRAAASARGSPRPTISP